MGRKFFDKSGTESLIPVVYARNITEAKLYQSLLEDQEITVVIEVPGPKGNQIPETMGIVVKVSEEDLEEAQALIDQHHVRDDYNEFGWDDYEQENESGVEGNDEKEGPQDPIAEKEAADEDYS